MAATTPELGLVELHLRTAFTFDERASTDRHHGFR
jgi:hypothetical protein